MKVAEYWRILAEQKGEGEARVGFNVRSQFARSVSDKIEREKRRAAKPEGETVEGEIIEETPEENSSGAIEAAEVIFDDCRFEPLNVESYEIGGGLDYETGFDESSIV